MCVSVCEHKCPSGATYFWCLEQDLSLAWNPLIQLASPVNKLLGPSYFGLPQLLR